MSTVVSSVEDILGADAAPLLQHQCKTIPKDTLHLPGPDFVERIHLQSDRPIGHGHWADLAEGYGAVRRSPALMCVLVAWSTVMLASGFVNVSEIFLAKRSYDAGDLGLDCSGPVPVSAS